MVQLDQFPMFRLTALLMRQLSSPIASRIKVYARDHPRFSRLVCARAANVYCSLELRARLLAARAAGARATGHCAPLSNTQALELGSSILGESVLFLLLAVILIFEMNRQAMKQEAKEAAVAEEWAEMLASLESMRDELQRQQLHLDSLGLLLREITDPEDTRATRTAEDSAHRGDLDVAAGTTHRPPSSQYDSVKMKSSNEPPLNEYPTAAGAGEPAVDPAAAGAGAGAAGSQPPHEDTPPPRRARSSEC